MQVFSGPSNCKLGGLAHANDDPVSPLITTTEHLCGKWRTLFLRRNSAGKLEVVQSLVIKETLYANHETLVAYCNWVTFALSHEGNLLCAIRGSKCLHEFCCAPSASRFPFEDTPRKHPLSNTVRCICGLQSINEFRLVASFIDNIIRVFRLAGGALAELQRITPPQSTWTPYTLVALPGGSLIVDSGFTDPLDLKGKQGIECCATNSDGTLSPPKRLFAQDLSLWLWGLLPPTEAFPTYRLVVNNDNSELCLYSIKSQYS